MIRPFRLHRPTTIGEAVDLAGRLPEAAFYRGGTELLLVMKLGFARFDDLIDLKGIEGLGGIEIQPDGSIRIGAAATHREVERSTIVEKAYPAMAGLERHLANPRVRNIGSLGGNLCFAEPHSDPATFLLAIGARLELEGPAGRRALGIDEFIVDAMTTALEPGELLVSIILPPPRPGEATGYDRRALVERPAASVACRLSIADGVVVDAVLAIGAVASRPVLATDAAELLRGVPLADLEDASRAIPERIAASLDVDDDPTVSAEYKQHLVGVLARRTVLATAASAGSAASAAEDSNGR